ncbi:XYPPX repeat family protein [Histomonas meleagridis]|uniref:XYPPX repeat family protein n=1 Tax=Histomonas meleagridis TaxID=135588 RepID=UPI00355AAE5D|nr:XYPPX repeat family protein [Histomonas meleagridis]KAH0797109.1 XYPPX repeat family protein [Histomonas meleagridis]
MTDKTLNSPLITEEDLPPPPPLRRAEAAQPIDANARFVDPEMPIDPAADYPPQGAEASSPQGINVRPQQQFKGTYDVYNVLYNANVSPANWSTSSCDITDNSAEFWGNPETFEPNIYSNRAYRMKRYNNYVFSIFFFLNLIVTITVGSVAISRTIRFTIGNALGICFLFSFVFIILNFLFMWLFPELYLKIGVWIEPVFGIIGMIIGCCCKFYLSIGWWALVIVLAVFYFFFTRHSITFSKCLLQMSIRTQFFMHPSNFIFLASNIILITFVAIYFGYSFVCIRSVWSSSGIAANIYMFLSMVWIINTITNMVYMSSGSAASAYYYTNGTIYDIKFPISKSLLRSYFFNLGSAARAAITVPLSEYIHVVGRFEARSVFDRIFAKNVSSFFVNFIKKLSYVAALFAKPIDILFTYPTRQGLLYSSIFGVPFDEGCRRFAEISVKNYCNLLNEIQTIGSNLAFHTLSNVIITTYTTYAILKTMNLQMEPSVDRIISSNVAAPLSIVYAYGIAMVFRQMLRGHYEGLLLGFSEYPIKLRSTNSEIAETFEQQFKWELQARSYSNERNAEN